MEPRVFGAGLRGPAHADVTALAWNPAALGLLDGYHLYAEVGASLGFGMYERDPLDRFPGDSSDSPRTFDSADYDSLAHGYFLGVSLEIPRTPVTFGLGGYTPFVETSDPGDWPGAYYRREVDWYHLTAPTLALSYRAAGSLFFGVGVNINWSWMHTSFDRDLTLEGGSPELAIHGYEDDGAAQNVVVETHGGPDFTAALGVLYRRRTLNVGVSWQLRPQPVRTSGSVRVADRRGTFWGRASAEYELPDVVNAGVEWRATENLATSLTLRYVSSSLHDQIKIRPSGNELVIVDEEADTEETVVPDSIVFHRGFQDLWSLDGAASYAVHPALELGAGARLETSAVKERKVNPAQIDGPKVAGRTFAVWRPVRWFSLGATWELTVVRDRVIDESDFDPAAAIRCIDSGRNVDDCDELSSGRALPDPRGRYELLVHRFMAGISLDRW